MPHCHTRLFVRRYWHSIRIRIIPRKQVCCMWRRLIDVGTFHHAWELMKSLLPPHPQLQQHLSAPTVSWVICTIVVALFMLLYASLSWLPALSRITSSLATAEKPRDAVQDLDAHLQQKTLKVGEYHVGDIYSHALLLCLLYWTKYTILSSKYSWLICCID